MRKETITKIIKYLFIIYCLVLFYILFLYGARMGNVFHVQFFSKEHFAMVNIIPFKTIGEFVERMMESTINIDIVIRNIGANLLMFIPMGMALSVLFPKKFDKLWKMTAFIVGFVLLIEIIQFVTFRGSADIDDLILNVLSCIIGYGIVQMQWLRNLLKLDER